MDWEVCKLYSDSDHELVSFTINLKPPSPYVYFSSNWKFLESEKTDWSTFYSNFDNSSLYIPSNPSCEDIDHAVSLLEQAFQNAALKSLPLRSNLTKRIDKSKLWWDEELQAMQNTLKFLKNKLNHTNPDSSPVLWELRKRKHSQFRTSYFNLVKYKSNQAWREFITDAENHSPWGITSSLMKTLSHPSPKLEDDYEDDTTECSILRQHVLSLSNPEVEFVQPAEISVIISNITRNLLAQTSFQTE